MKSHISDSDLQELSVIHNHWNQMRVDQDQCVRRMCDLLGCDMDEAIDLLNSCPSAIDTLDAKGIEVHREEHCRPWPRPRVDGETLLVLGIIVCGVASVVGATGIGF